MPLRLALLATLVSLLDLRALRSLPHWQVPSALVRRQAMALVDSPLGGDVSAIPKLEPDILGGWFVLDTLAHGP